MTKLEHYRISQIQANSLFETRIYNLFKAAISDEIGLEQFRKLFTKCDKIDLHIMKRNEHDIGLAYFMSFKNPKHRKDIFLRLGIGIVKEERGKSNFPKILILRMMIKTKLQNLFKNVYMVAITMNPIVYSATCKYWKYTYPNPDRVTTDEILAVKERVVEFFRLEEIVQDVIEFPFSLNSISDTKRKFSNQQNANSYIRYFMSKINGNEYDKGLLNIVPITSTNLRIGIFRKTKNDTKKLLHQLLASTRSAIIKEYSTSAR